MRLAEQRLAEARELAKTNTSRLPVQSIDEQIAFNNSQISSLRSMKAREDAIVQQRSASQARAPLVQQRMSELQQRLSTLNQQYDEVQGRLLSAQAGLRAEDEQMGERLVVVEPPIIPTEPIWPNRLILFALGIGGGLGLGLVLAFGFELLMQPIREPAALGKASGSSNLGVVPSIEMERGDQPISKRRWPWQRQAKFG